MKKKPKQPSMFYKLCSKCGEYKTLFDFSWKSGAKDHRQSYCRECNAKYLREYRAL